MSFDPIELTIFKHLFASIAEEMGVRLMRSAYSPNIKERRDYSCAFFDQKGGMIAQAAHIPVHLGSTPMSVEAVLKAFSDTVIKAEDVFIVNDPYDGGTHLPDITVVAPCFLEGEELPRFWVVNRAHHADVGGKRQDPYRSVVISMRRGCGFHPNVWSRIYSIGSVHSRELQTKEEGIYKRSSQRFESVSKDWGNCVNVMGRIM